MMSEFGYELHLCTTKFGEEENHSAKEKYSVKLNLFFFFGKFC